MAFSITQFENNLQNSLVALDNNFTTFGALVPIPCTVSGTNTLTLTQNSTGLVPTPTISAYTTGMLFTTVASATNTSATQATVGSVGFLNIYKDTLSGPALLSGGEIVANNAISLLYDGALGGGAGGFHLIATTANVSSPISPSTIRVNGNSTITNLLSGTVAITFTATPGWSSQDQAFSVTASLAASLPATGDFVQVCPPSIAAAGVGYSGFVSAVGSLSSVASAATVLIRLINSASASLGSNSGTYRWSALRTVP